MTLTKCIFYHWWLRLCQMQANISSINLEQTFYRLTYSPIPLYLYFPQGHSCETVDCNFKQERSTVKTFKHNLLDERSVVDRHQSHMAAKFGVCLIRIMATFLRYIGYKKYIKRPYKSRFVANFSSCTTTE